MDLLQAAVADAFRVLLIASLPMVGIVAVASLAFAVLQATMAIRDGSSLFAVRAVALIVALYFFLPAIIAHVTSLTLRVLG